MDESPPISLPHLTAFELGQLDVNRDTLLAVLSRFAPKLTRLSLWRITIEAEKSGPYDTKPNIWSQFFRGLTAIPELGLTYLKVGALSQSHHTAVFKNEVGGNEKSEMTREYSGKDIARFVRSLADDVVVEWPPEITMDSDASNSDEDEDMYDDEDDEEEDEDEDDNEDGEDD